MRKVVRQGLAEGIVYNNKVPGDVEVDGKKPQRYRYWLWSSRHGNLTMYSFLSAVIAATLDLLRTPSFARRRPFG